VLFFGRQETPFIFTSGWASPVYIDLPQAGSSTSTRPQSARSWWIFARRHAVRRDRRLRAVRRDPPAARPAGIPYAAWIADRFGLADAVQSAKKAKGSAANAQIEGDVRRGAARPRLLVEDLTTDVPLEGQLLCKALREGGRGGGPRVSSIFYYGHNLPRVEEGDDGARRAAAPPRPPTWWDVLRVVKQAKLPARSRRVGESREIPSLPAAAEWSAAHGRRSPVFPERLGSLFAGRHAKNVNGKSAPRRRKGPLSPGSPRRRPTSSAWQESEGGRGTRDLDGAAVRE